MKNYHTNDNVTLVNDLIYVNGKLVCSINDDREYWEYVLKEQENNTITL